MVHNPETFTTQEGVKMPPMPENMLQGYHIGLTADRRWAEQAELLRRRGAAILHGPAIRTHPLGPGLDLRAATEALIADHPDFLVANTGIGIRSWFAAADAWGLGEHLHGALSRARIFARGPKASAEIHRAGLSVEAKAESERLEDTVALLPLAELTGRRVAFQRHGDASPEAIEPIAAAGASIVEVPVYRWTLPDDLRPCLRLAEATVAGRLHAVTFTSAPAVRNFFAITDDAGLGEAVRRRLNTDVIAACVGPVCGAAAIAERIEAPLVPERARLGPLVRTLSDALTERDVHCELGGLPVVLRGCAVAVGETSVVLTEREAALLRVLLQNSGTVCSKEALLRAVWGDASDDPHTVEVMIGRLRRRLGLTGAAIMSVPRRGYKVT